IYCNKFIDRIGTEDGNRGLLNALYGSNTNANDAPVFRYGEVLLNWIEAKAEVATLGGSAVTQSDINKSINALRDRPLDANAIGRGVQKTVAMDISSLPNDPERDSDVSELIWEIRRERRMEMAYEYCRLYDIKRWKKLDYMKTSSSPKFSDNMLGPWINYSTELPDRLTGPTGAYAGVMKVQKTDGTIVVYNGSNDSDMVGFAVAHNAQVRNEDVSAKQYFAPVPVPQITLYETKGYVLTQTPGW
ncbi:MAG: RagB/SusD family nutrient uptake outer membrane protein, partial [Prevotellaceae bacterium]|nr:RagB/SusD family nutrient uptake outer membrane protein [Prevotellaceae bacterium]